MPERQDHPEAEPKRERGRPAKWEYPERIDASPEEIADVVLGARPKKTWRFEEDRKRRSQ